MTFLQSILLGLIQGVAEFLPISSSGHLAIAQNLLRPLLRRPADEYTGPAEVLRLVPAHHQLDLSQLQRHTVHM